MCIYDIWMKSPCFCGNGIDSLILSLIGAASSPFTRREPGALPGSCCQAFVRCCSGLAAGVLWLLLQQRLLLWPVLLRPCWGTGLSLCVCTGKVPLLLRPGLPLSLWAETLSGCRFYPTGTSSLIAFSETTFRTLCLWD